MPSAPLPRTQDPANRPSVSEEIRPSSRGIVFSPRPLLNTGKNVRSLRGHSSPAKHIQLPPPQVSPANSTVMLLARPNLTPMEVESMLQQKVTDNSDAIRRAFLVYDAERCENVTKGEFRRVLDNYCLPLTTSQFNNLLSKIEVNANGTIPYAKFLEKFTGIPRSVLSPGRHDSKNLLSSDRDFIGGKATAQRLDPNQPKYVVATTSKDQSMDTIERKLQHSIASNLKNVVRGFQLFDYNRDGQIQRHELKRVLDNYSLKMTEAQFDRLWSRYDFHHVGTIDYRDFLRRLGVNAATGERQVARGVKESLESGDIAGPIPPWDAKKKKRQREKEITDLVLKRNQEKTQHRSHVMDDMTMVQIEKKFRNKMQTNQVNIERAMRSFDYCSDGFITIDDLKAVIDNFVMPTTDELFQQLMYRFSVRGTGKISWEQFVGKFQDPQGVGNGQTLPIGQNHKVNPVRAGLSKATAPEVFAKLRTHVLENFSSLKNAFLALDDNQKGVLTRKDVRRIIESFTMKLSDNNVKELFAKLDPEHTGFINYQNFLDIFEQKESVKAHKWLYSKHKVNQNQPPAILAWDTVEEILREKLSENYRQVADEFAAMDTLGQGTIKRGQLRRILDRYALPLSDEHFEKLWSACPEVDAHLIQFSCFLDNLGIDVRPGDLEGPSTRIHDESNAAEMQRQEEHQDRMNGIAKVNLKHTMRFSAKEVITKLKHRMAQHDTGIRKTFLKHSKSGRGRVTKKDLRLMLEEMGFLMDDVQFKEFTSMLNCDKKGLTYSDFVACFQDLRTRGMGEELERAGNHVVNKTNLVYMTAMECYEQIIERMRQNYSSVRNAFFKVDDDHDGILTMHEFRRMLDSFMFIITDETFYELLKMLGLHKKSLLSYFEFMEKFEIVDRPEGHPWLNSKHRFNTVRKPIEMTADMVHECLCLKAEQAWADMVRTFRNFDADGNGIITRRDLRALLFRYTLPLSHDQFQQLWKRYDDEEKGYITQADFLLKLGRTLAPGDNLGLQGTSRKIIEENVDNIRNHLNFQEAKHKEIAQNQSLLSKHYTAEQVERELKDRFRQYYATFDHAFKHLDRNRDGYVTLTDLQRILVQLNYFLDEQQFIGLLKRLGLTVINDRLSYFDFLRAIDDGRASKYGDREAAGRRREQVMWKSYDNLPVEKALAKLKDKVTVNYDSLNSGFRAFDRAQTGTVSVSDFRRLLDNFCFKMTDKQFRAVLAKCKITTASNNSTKLVNWIVFLHEFSQIRDTKLKEWTDYVGKAAPPQTVQEMSLEQVEERIREVVTGRYNVISNAFTETDYANIFVVSKEDFREILNEHVMRLSVDQFNRLWSKLPVNEFHNLDYKEFLKRYKMDVRPSEAKTEIEKIPDGLNGLNPPIITGGLPRDSLIYTRKLESRAASVDSLSSSRAGSIGDLERRSNPLVNAESTEMKLKPLVYRNWQKIQRECRKLDIDKSGTILPDEFVGIIDAFGLILTIEEARALMMKYDIGNKSGMFAYQDFLRNFILKMKPSEENIMKRKQIRIGKSPIITGKDNPGFLTIMMNLKQRIPLFWKEMRRTFKLMDTRGNGYVTASVFRQVLRRFTINLTEEDFFNLLSFYDPKMEGKLPYNEFIRAFL